MTNIDPNASPPEPAVSAAPSQEAAAPANANASYTLGKGQVLQFTQNAELNGSVITSDTPVGLWGGHTCMNVPNTMVACDAAHQQIPPVQAMGNRYAAVRYRNRFANIEE